MKLNKLVYGFLFLIVVSFMASCTESMKITSDYNKSTDFARYKTFSVYQLVTTANVNKFNAERIVNALRNEMIKKGFKENNSHPDLVVTAVTVLKDKQSISATGTSGWYRPYRDVNIQTNKYKEGTLVIDIFDAKEESLVWEGTAYSEIDKQPKDPEKTINHVVSKVLATFPSTETKGNNHSTM